jgi:site-specific DNA-methyltransferase (adenine-specific)
MHWRDLAKHVRRTVGQVDALIVDAPYSAVTHGGHDVMVEHLGAADNVRRHSERRGLSYPAWHESDVASFVASWSAAVGGWFVTLTDHVLAPAWIDALEDAGRYTFAPLPLVETGGRVRLSGDGPSSWTTWVVVARPRSRRFMSWGTLPGAYVMPAERKDVVGGKPLAAMERLVEDYTCRGDLVCDPCMGAGTTLLAAKLLGRRYIGGDLDEKHVEIARERLRDLPAQPKAGTLALPWEKP